MLLKQNNIDNDCTSVKVIQILIFFFLNETIKIKYFCNRISSISATSFIFRNVIVKVSDQNNRMTLRNIYVNPTNSPIFDLGLLNIKLYCMKK